jgi:hypothetical protein
MTCGEALDRIQLIAQGRFRFDDEVLRVTAETVERHWRRACSCFTEHVAWPFARKVCHFDWELFED